MATQVLVGNQKCPKDKAVLSVSDIIKVNFENYQLFWCRLCGDKYLKVNGELVPFVEKGR